jgi:membrane-associated phospholipid phosphatase
MLEALETGLGLDIVLWLQQNRSGLSDFLAVLLDQLGGDIGYLLLLPVVYWGISRRMGRELVYVLLIGMIGMVAMKELLMRPRPYMASDLITPLFTEDGYGLPSGHVTLSLVTWGYVAYQVRRWWAWVLIGLWVLAVGWARMAAGVHYPQDVVGGLIWGSALLVFALATVKRFGRWWDQAASWQAALLIAVVAVLAYVFTYEDETGLSAVGLVIGAGLGALIEQRRLHFSAGGSLSKRVIRCVIGAVLAVGVFFGLRVVFSDLSPYELWRILRYAVVAFTLVFVWPWLSVRFGLTQAAAPTPDAATVAKGA